MKVLTAASAAFLICAGAGAATAGSYVLYGPGGVTFGFGSDIGPVGYGPTVPCRYPDGWNAGDAAQAFRGVPVGIHHRCRIQHGVVVDSDGDPTE